LAPKPNVSKTFPLVYHLVIERAHVIWQSAQTGLTS
jgi:hypothetical protein